MALKTIKISENSLKTIEFLVNETKLPNLDTRQTIKIGQSINTLINEINESLKDGDTKIITDEKWTEQPADEAK